MANLIRRRAENSNLPASQGRQEYAWDPFRVMDALFRLDPLRGAGEGWLSRGSEFMPSFDLKESKDAYVLRADLPGVKEDDIEVTVTGNVVTVSGKREQESREEGDQYFAIERSYGGFSRAFSLPDGANLDDVKADLKAGVLTVSIPKRPEVQPKKVSVGRGEPEAGRAKS
jgi:HSP20 family protein